MTERGLSCCEPLGEGRGAAAARVDAVLRTACRMSETPSLLMKKQWRPEARAEARILGPRRQPLASPLPWQLDRCYEQQLQHLGVDPPVLRTELLEALDHRRRAADVDLRLGKGSRGADSLSGTRHHVPGLGHVFQHRGAQKNVGLDAGR